MYHREENEKKIAKKGTACFRRRIFVTSRIQKGLHHADREREREGWGAWEKQMQTLKSRYIGQGSQK